MLKIHLATTIGVATLIAGGAAMATGPAHPAATESGTAYHGAEYAKVDGRLARVDTWNTQTGASAAPKANDDWEFIGGDAGWQLRQHRYDLVNGRLVHSDDIPHDTPKPAFNPRATDLPRGPADSGG